MEIRRFDTGRYPFARLVSEALSVNDLAQVHSRSHPGQHYELFTAHTDQSTEFHRRFYQEALTTVLPLYRTFVREQIAPLIPEDRFVFQKVPTFRVHLPGNVAVGEFHKDADYGHPDGEVGFWLPLTRAFSTCTLVLESSPDRGDFQEVNLEYGEFLEFDPVNQRHGNRVNSTGQTRVSIDFRVLPRSRYRHDTDRVSFNQKLQFRVGGYYQEFPIQEGA